MDKEIQNNLVENIDLNDINSELNGLLDNECYETNVGAENKDLSVGDLVNAVISGERTFYQKEQTERKKFDDSWITTIESYYPSIYRITRNIRSSLRYEQDIIPIEKAKRVTPESIRHLTSNTHNIHQLEGDDVMPKRILTDLSEIEYGIYENRFIMTLVFRLRDYCHERLEIIKKHLYAQKTTRLNASGVFNLDDSEYEVTFDVKRTRSFKQRKTDEHNLNVYARAERLNKLIDNLTTSAFIKEMKRYKPVTPPIIKTQIILKNPDFRNAYLLWLYLDKNYQLNFNQETETRQKRFDKNYLQHLNKNIVMLASNLAYEDLEKPPIDAQEFFNGSGYDKPTIKEVPAKTVSRLPDELTAAPEAFTPEPQAMNEYYLNRMRQLLKQSLKTSISENASPAKARESLKQSLEDAINITNALYEAEFGYNADDDIFVRLVKSKDPKLALEEAYEKQRIATAVRQVKEKDYERAVALEKKWHAELIEKQKQLIEEEKRQSEQRISQALEKETEKLDAAIVKALQAEQRAAQTQIKKELAKLAQLRKKLSDQLREERRKILEEERKRLLKERLRLKKEKEREKQMLLTKMKREAERAMSKISSELKTIESQLSSKTKKRTSSKAKTKEIKEQTKVQQIEVDKVSQFDTSLENNQASFVYEENNLN